MKNSYYIIYVWGDVEPNLSQPFETSEARDEDARRMRRDDTEENGEGYSGIYWMDVIDEKISVGSYSGNFFGEEDDDEEM